MFRWGLSRLSHSEAARWAVTRFPLAQPVVRRFVAGEDLGHALQVARAISDAGMLFSLDYLGEAVDSRTEVKEATEIAIATLKGIAAAGLDGNISIKPTQLGLDISSEVCYSSLGRILDAARELRAANGQVFVRIDMEASCYVEATLQLIEAMWVDGLRNVGTVLQSCLRRTPSDLRRMNELGIPIRLVKGAYREPRAVAFPQKADVDRAFKEGAETLLTSGIHPAFATHDEGLIRHICSFAEEQGVERDVFEFQMLYGVRRDLAAELAEAGFKVRIYVPFGDAWYPYLMRRLAERPANLMFMVNSVVAESGLGGIFRRGRS